MSSIQQFEASLLQHLSLPTFVIDTQRRVLQWNRACEELTGVAAAAVIGTDRHWSCFYGAERPTLADLALDPSALLTAYPVASRDREGLRAEGWYRNLNGRDRYLSFYAAPIYDGDGILLGAIETISDITVHKRNEESLRKLSCAVEQSPHVVMITDASGSIEYVNPKFSDLTGYPPEEVLGRHPGMLDSGRLPLEHFQGMLDTVSSGREWRGEFFSRKKNGELYWESASVFPVKDQEGGITHYVSIKQDITGQKLAGEQIRETLSLLHATLESTADGIMVRDLAGRCVTYNRRFAEIWQIPESLLGTCSDELMRRHAMKLIVDPEAFRALTERLYRHIELETSDVIRLKDGRVLERVSRPQVREGTIIGRVISFRDVTEQKRAEEALRESAERYRTLVDNIDLGITLIDTEHRVVTCNKAAARILKRQPDQMAGKQCREIPGAGELCDNCPGMRAMRTGKPATVLRERSLEGRGASLKISAFPVLGAAGQVAGFIEVVQDITEQLQAERERELLEAQLRQSQKFEAIGTLAGGIAHDFNNFLTVITSYGALIDRKLPPGDPCRAYLSKIFSAAEKAAKLTGGLLAYSRKQPLATRNVDLTDIIQKLYGLLDRLVGDDITLTLSLPDRPLNVLADSLQMEQVLMNLAANARDAMPRGGGLEITARLLRLDRDFVREHGYGSPGEYAVITVSDTGEGIDGVLRERIFEPFFTTKEVGKGTGLGLSMVYGIVKQHNGHINLESEPGQGSSFRIYLPLCPGASREVSCGPAGNCSGGNETLLLVEDDDGIRESLKELLQWYGYRVIEAVDGEDGIRAFRKQHGRVDLLLLDLVMPNKNGKEVYEAIRQLAPGIPALFMSGYAADILSAKGVLREEVNLISKPVSITDLCTKIREVLDCRAAA
jgi:two-component system, cell cycle sensor histidine kinase and response regulator CckA